MPLKTLGFNPSNRDQDLANKDHIFRIKTQTILCFWIRINLPYIYIKAQLLLAIAFLNFWGRMNFVLSSNFFVKILCLVVLVEIFLKATILRWFNLLSSSGSYPIGHVKTWKNVARSPTACFY